MKDENRGVSDSDFGRVKNEYGRILGSRRRGVIRQMSLGFCFASIDGASGRENIFLSFF